jgi:hypothetical protein
MPASSKMPSYLCRPLEEGDFTMIFLMKALVNLFLSTELCRILYTKHKERVRSWFVTSGEYF